MTFSEIFKNSFLEAIYTGDISVWNMLSLIGLACVFAAYIFFVYRILTRKTFYSKEFNISLAIITIIVTSIVITIQSSLVVSLGMVGALSIVRFRTAVKNPMDLIFLFWAIAVGIIVGAGLPGIAFVMTAIITLAIFILDLIPISKASKLIILNNTDKISKDNVISCIEKHCKSYQIKSFVEENNKIDMIVEVRISKVDSLMEELSLISGIGRCSYIEHNGETTFLQ